MKWLNPFARLSKTEQIIHVIIWGIGLALINIPSWTITIGPFHSEDFSLIIPSIYGVFLNAKLFYSSAYEIEVSRLKNINRNLINTLRIFMIITMIESGLDAGYFVLHYFSITVGVISEIILGQILMNFIFFYLPSLMFGFIKAWQRNETEPKEKPRMAIKDGHKKIYLNPDRLAYIESDGNYTIFHEEKKYTVRQSLSQAQEDLPDYFIRIHKSFIVNKQLIQQKSYDQLVVAGFIIPIGRKYRENLK